RIDASLLVGREPERLVVDGDGARRMLLAVLTGRLATACELDLDEVGHVAAARDRADGDVDGLRARLDIALLRIRGRLVGAAATTATSEKRGHEAEPDPSDPVHDVTPGGAFVPSCRGQRLARAIPSKTPSFH